MAALAMRIVGLEPGAEPELPEVVAIIRQNIARRPAPLRRQVGLFLGLLRWLPALLFGAPFERLSVYQQTVLLTWFQGSPVSLLRKGFWGVKALVFMGYYTRPQIGPQLGYRPVASGNDMLHG